MARYHVSAFVWNLLEVNRGITGHFTVSHDNIITQQSGKLEFEREDVLWDERMTAEGDEKWDNGQFNLDKLWDPPPSLHIWDRPGDKTHVTRDPGYEWEEQFPVSCRHFPRSQSRHRRNWLSWETPSQISDCQCWHPHQTTDSTAGPALARGADRKLKPSLDCLDE